MAKGSGISSVQDKPDRVLDRAAIASHAAALAEGFSRSFMDGAFPREALPPPDRDIDGRSFAGRMSVYRQGQQEGCRLDSSGRMVAHGDQIIACRWRHKGQIIIGILTRAEIETVASDVEARIPAF